MNWIIDAMWLFCRALGYAFQLIGFTGLLLAALIGIWCGAQGVIDMYTVEAYKARLARAAETAITDTPDGRPWYPARAVCRALCLDADKVFPKIRRDYKYTVTVSCGRYQRDRRLYLSRAGVETLILIKGGLPRAEMLDALPS